MIRAEIRRLPQQMHTASRLESVLVKLPLIPSDGEQAGGAQSSGLSAPQYASKAPTRINIRRLASAPKSPTEVIGC